MVLLCSLDGHCSLRTRLGSNWWVSLLLLPAECWDYRCVPAYLAGKDCQLSRIRPHRAVSVTFNVSTAEEWRTRAVVHRPVSCAVEMTPFQVLPGDL